MNTYRTWQRWQRLLFTCMAIMATSHPCGAFAANSNYDVGIAKVDITPDYPIRLNGFGDRREESVGVTQQIWAKAMAIGADDQKPAILFTIDSTGIRELMIDEVAVRLKEKAGIERDRIAATFTHTHTAPKVNGACDTIFSTPIPQQHQAHIDRYTRELTEALAQVALSALADRKPARLDWAVGKVGFAKNRRTEGGPVDHSLPLLVVRSAEDDALRAIYVTYACHCVTLSDNKISGDWAGYAQHAIESKHPGVVAMTSIGCGSDSNPSSGVTGANTAAAAGQGAEIADEVERLLGGTLKPISGHLSSTLHHINLPLNTPPTREDLAQLAAEKSPVGYNAQYQLAKLARGEPLLTALDYPIQTFAFGDSLAMVFLSGEVCVDYSLRLKRELDPQRVWMHGYSNDFCAYIPSERLLNEGGYGGGAEIVYFGLPNTLAPGLEELIIAEVHTQVPRQFKNQATPNVKAAVDAQRPSSVQPRSPREALTSIRVKDGFVVEIVAAEPLVADPVAIDVGPDGRLWVAEMPDYTRFADEAFEPTGSVRVLTDDDGDGRYDAAIAFQSGLRFPTDVKAWRNGVIVCDAPDVIYLEDADGDGKADVRRTLLTGFETHNAQARVNSLRWGLDNWLYGSCGLFGGDITTSSGAKVNLGGRDFRFRPNTGELEAVTGSTQQGRARDDWDNWFGCDNGHLVDHYPLSDHYLARNPHIAPPPAEVYVPQGDNQLYPIAAPTLYKLSGPPGRPTSACGLGFYCDELLGDEYANNAFVAEPVNQLVHRRVLTPRGATFTGARAADEVNSEFLASTDPWFRPVQIRTGPDGCLWVVDMYRAIIEHPKFIPEEARRSLDLMAGREQGRIYRVRPRDKRARPIARLDDLEPAGLVSALDSPNGPQRDLAQQLLIQRTAVEAAPLLKELVHKSRRAATRLQALSTLDGLGLLDAELLTVALNDVHPAVRRHAIRLSEAFFADSPQLIDAVLRRAEDADPQIQLQLAYSLGQLDHPQAASALARIAMTHYADPYILAGVWSSLNKANIGAVVGSMFERVSNRDVPDSILHPAIRLTFSLGEAADVEAIARALSVDADRRIPQWRLAAVATLLEAARQTHGDASVATKALARQLDHVIAAAKQIVESDDRNDGERLAALRILIATRADSDALLPRLSEFLSPQKSPAMQRAAIDVAASMDAPSAGAALLSQWNGYTPAIRAKAFDVIVGRKLSIGLLLEKLTTGEVRAAELDALQRQRLLTHADESIRERSAAALSGGIDDDRGKTVEAYIAATPADGDGDRGRQIFAKHCASCHQLRGEGHHVGPDLAALTAYTVPALVESILDPNRVVDERYQSYTALTVDGLAHAGILAGETATSITLVEQQGNSRTLLRADLDSLQNSGKSLMPEGLERELSPQGVGDLIAYLAPVGPARKDVAGSVPATVVPDDARR